MKYEIQSLSTKYEIATDTDQNETKNKTIRKEKTVPPKIIMIIMSHAVKGNRSTNGICTAGAAVGWPSRHRNIT